MRVHASGWVFECGMGGFFLHASGFFFRYKSQSAGVLGIFLPFYVRGRVAPVDTVEVSVDWSFLGVPYTSSTDGAGGTFFSRSVVLVMPEEYVIGFVCSARQWRQLKSQSIGAWGGYFTFSTCTDPEGFFFLTGPTRRMSFF